MWRSIALPLLLLLVACGDHVGTVGAAATRTPIPWISAPPSFAPIPTMTPEPMPKNVAACRAADLSAEHAGAQGAGGWWTGGLRLMSKSRPCLLYGYVELRFRGFAGREMARSVPSAAGAQRDWAVLGEAQVLWTWGNWCTPNIAVASIVAMLPSDPTPIIARIDPPMLVGARCYDAGTLTSVSTGPGRPW